MRQRTSPLAEQVLERNAKDDDNSMKDPPVRLFLPTGCSLLNLALSDKVNGGWPCGRVVNPIGDSDTGKSVLAMTALAEASVNEAFDNHRLIYGDIESALTCHALFPEKVRDRIELLSPCDEKHRAPETIEELHYNLLDLFKQGEPFIYVIDSFDALPSKQELEETQKHKEAHEKDKDSAGSYQMSKQKYSKKMFREVKGLIADTDSLVMVVSQTIANIGSSFNPKAVAGGSALEFFSRIRFWLSVKASHKVKDRVVGRQIKCKVSKNHITGKKREVPFWVFDNLGIDDIRTTVDFLCTENVWSKVGGWIVPKGLDDSQKFQMTDLIRFIENNDHEDRLRYILQDAWNSIEGSLVQKRKSRYE